MNEMKLTIEQLQNEIAIEEFKRNYNKKEYERDIEDMKFGKTEKMYQLKKLLEEQYAEYEIEVSHTGTYYVYKQTGENRKSVIEYKIAKVRLPYEYQMGKAISKKRMQQWLEVIN